MWLFLFLPLMWLQFHPTGSELHSLTYIYTAFNKPYERPGIHMFTAMGMLDGRMIDYYDSKTKEKVPKQEWMRERLDKEYWAKGTQSRQSKEQWFGVNIGILMKRMNQTDEGHHTLQWRHGCVIENGLTVPPQFKSGMDMYSYDGEDFLSFNDADSNWIAPVPEAELTKRKWDGVQVLKEYTKSYLEKECVDWLTKFMVYGEKDLKKASPPDVYVFARTSKKNSANNILTCMATGFYPKDIIMKVRRNGRVLDKDDGLQSTGIRPNDDGTHQIRMSVEILNSDSAEYICEVEHRATNMKETRIWDHEVKCDCTGGIIGGALGGLLVGVLLVGAAVFGVLMFMYVKRKGPFANRGRAKAANTPSAPTPIYKGSVAVPIPSVTAPLLAPNGAANGTGSVAVPITSVTTPLLAPNGAASGTGNGPPNRAPNGPPNGAANGAANGAGSGPPNGPPNGAGNGAGSGPPNGTHNGAGNGAGSGPPNGTPNGAGSGAGSGPPNGTPNGAGNGAGSGPPNGTPNGPSNGTEGGPPEQEGPAAKHQTDAAGDRQSQGSGDSGRGSDEDIVKSSSPPEANGASVQPVA
ncbi:major histocompatibility complex class I-related gene protein-like isoform X7 [Myripristis murdjan]|uniref:major histocompatibility complex class I-related gene protein-like isoform X7 n=1 Tax=Myripristis murdjan TaxID=586833 RepID=UPI001175E531|nr:major histocompatibility complex class I-related gene protein-like isoform X7 [Myripristis murdjan]